MSAKFDNEMSQFFVYNPDRKLLLIQKLQRYIHFYSSPHSISKSAWLDWKKPFREAAYRDCYWAQNLTMTHSFWTSHWHDWKTLFVRQHIETFMSAKFDNDMSHLFAYKQDQRFLLIQNLQECIHSYSSPHSIWRSPWIDRKTPFKNLHTEIFIGANFDNDISTFYVDKADQKFFLF